MQGWEILCRLATLLSSRYFWMLHLLLSHCWAQGLWGRRIPRISDPLATCCHCLMHGTPDTGWRAGWISGIWGEAEGQRSRRNRGVIPKNGLSLYPSLLLPHDHVSQATTSPVPRMAIPHHIHCHYSGVLMVMTGFLQTLYSFPAHTLLC